VLTLMQSSKFLEMYHTIIRDICNNLLWHAS